MNPVVSVVASALVATSPLSAASQNPPVSIPPSSGFVAACYGQATPTIECDRQAIANINWARGAEHMNAIVLPADYSSLGIQGQLAAVINAERTSRGLGSLATVPAWNSLAVQGARSLMDPMGPGGDSWGSIWAGVADPLAADFLWMYDDGSNSPNLDCQPATPSGCWGHRENILGAGWTSMGSGASGASVAALFVQ